MESTKKRQEEATSKETLKDIEESEVSSDDSTDQVEAPSPDGAFDEDDELKDADPV